jgi:hypothetical protein
MKRTGIRLTSVAALLWLAACTTPPPAGDTLQAAGWRPVPLPGKKLTAYALDVSAGRPHAIRAEADASASMLRRAAFVAPEQLGRVRFSWRVAELIVDADLSDRESADSPVRVVLAFDGDHARLSARNRMLFELAQAVTGERPPYATLMYVWDNKAARETVFPGGRSDRVRKIVVESGSEHRGSWRDYERSIAEDYRRAFGEEPGPLIAVGLMTDADNTRGRALAWYGAVELLPAAALASR